MSEENNEINIFTFDSEELLEEEEKQITDEIIENSSIDSIPQKEEAKAEISEATAPDLKNLAAVAHGIENNIPEGEKQEEALLTEEELYNKSSSHAENPLWRITVALIICSILGIVVFFVGTLGSSIVGGNQKTEDSSTVERQNNSNSSPEDETESEDSLKAELALIDQNSQPIPQTQTEPESPPQPQPKTELKPQPQAQPRPAPRTIPQPQPQRINPQTIEEEKKDPLEEWAALSQLGAMGHDRKDTKISQRTNNPEEVATTPNSASATRNRNQPSPSVFDRPKEDSLIASNNLTTVSLNNSNSSTQSSMKEANSLPSPTTRQYILGMPGTPTKTNPTDRNSAYSLTNSAQNTYKSATPETIVVPIGSTVAAEVVTDIISTEEQITPRRSTITLTEPLLDVNNKVALPSGSNLIVELASIQSNGMATLHVVAISYQDSQGQLQQQELPIDSLLVSDEDNSPLMAKKIGDTSNIGRDILIGGMAAGSKGFEVLNRPEEEVVEENNSSKGGYRRRSSQNNNSLVNGALEGMFSATQERLQNRSERIEDDLRNQPKVYRIQAGTAVQIYVNSIFEVNN